MEESTNGAKYTKNLFRRRIEITEDIIKGLREAANYENIKAFTLSTFAELVNEEINDKLGKGKNGKENSNYEPYYASLLEGEKTVLKEDSPPYMWVGHKRIDDILKYGTKGREGKKFELKNIIAVCIYLDKSSEYIKALIEKAEGKRTYTRKPKSSKLSKDEERLYKILTIHTDENGKETQYKKEGWVGFSRTLTKLHNYHEDGKAIGKDNIIDITLYEVDLDPSTGLRMTCTSYYRKGRKYVGAIEYKDEVVSISMEDKERGKYRKLISEISTDDETNQNLLRGITTLVARIDLVASYEILVPYGLLPEEIVKRLGDNRLAKYKNSYISYEDFLNISEKVIPNKHKQFLASPISTLFSSMYNKSAWYRKKERAAEWEGEYYLYLFDKDEEESKPVLAYLFIDKLAQGYLHFPSDNIYEFSAEANSRVLHIVANHKIDKDKEGVRSIQLMTEEVAHIKGRSVTKPPIQGALTYIGEDSKKVEISRFKLIKREGAEKRFTQQNIEIPSDIPRFIEKDSPEYQLFLKDLEE